MQVAQTPLSGVLVVTPKRFGDARGFFSEIWNGRTLAQSGVHRPDFVQDNHSISRDAGTLRGLHYQAPPRAQGKLVRCGQGRLFDVAVDVRRGSDTYGMWFGTELSFENGRQMWVPPGFLHGFVTRVPNTEIVYKCTDYYDPECEGAVHWNSIGIDWGIRAPILSDKDARAPQFSEFRSPFVFEE